MIKKYGRINWRALPRTPPSLAERLHHRRGGPDFCVHAVFVLFEVFDEQPRKLFRARLVSRRVGPGVARPENLRRHAGTFGSDLETKYRVAPRSGACKRATMDGIDNSAGVGQLDP